jgi:hypothetical protein
MIGPARYSDRPEALQDFHISSAAGSSQQYSVEREGPTVVAQYYRTFNNDKRFQISPHTIKAIPEDQ